MDIADKSPKYKKYKKIEENNPKTLILKLFLIPFTIYIIIKYKTKTKTKIKSAENLIISKPKNDTVIIPDIKVCLCTIGRDENRYIREFVSHYEKYGVDKIFLYDNNIVNGEKFEDVINDYVQKGFVEILNWRGKEAPIFSVMNESSVANPSFHHLQNHHHMHIQMFLIDAHSLQLLSACHIYIYPS